MCRKAWVYHLCNGSNCPILHKKKTLLVWRIHKHYENGDCLTIAPGFVVKPDVSPFNDDAYTSNIDVHLQSYKSKAFADY